MFTYSIVQWMAFFYIYCFVGWVIESTVVSFKEKHFVNRGFLRIPMLPIYGFGAIAILFATLPVESNPTLVFICGALSCSILEYFTGVIMEAIFKVKYWDYSDMEFNLNGKVCAATSLFWGFLSLLLTYQLHFVIEKLVLFVSTNALIVLVLIITLIFLADVVYSTKTAFDVKKVLAKLTEIKEEMESLVSQTIEQSEKAQLIKEKMAHLTLERQKISSKLSFYPRQLLKAHPKATSLKFNDALKDLKIAIRTRKHK